MIATFPQTNTTPASFSRSRRGRPASKKYRRDHGHVADQPLRPWQIVKLKQLEKTVFDYFMRNDALDVPHGTSKSAFFKEWTHEQQRLIFADGRESMKEAMQSDWRSIRSHFLAYLPNGTEEAYDQAARSGQKAEANSQAVWYLMHELKLQGRDIRYAEELAKDKFGRPIADLTAEQIFKGVLATLRHRRDTAPALAATNGVPTAEQIAAPLHS